MVIVGHSMRQTSIGYMTEYPYIYVQLPGHTLEEVKREHPVMKAVWWWVGGPTRDL